MTPVAELFLACIGAAGFTSLVQFSLGEPRGDIKTGRIFSRLGAWAAYKYDAFARNNPPLRPNPWKLLCCSFCQNVWFTTAAYVGTVAALGVSWWWVSGLPLGLGVSHAALAATDFARSRT